MHIFSAHVTHVTFTIAVRHSIAEHTKMQNFLVEAHEIMRNTSILNILWDIMFQHRKLVVVLMRYIDITLLDVW